MSCDRGLEKSEFEERDGCMFLSEVGVQVRAKQSTFMREMSAGCVWRIGSRNVENQERCTAGWDDARRTSVVEKQFIRLDSVVVATESKEMDRV